MRTTCFRLAARAAASFVYLTIAAAAIVTVSPAAVAPVAAQPAGSQPASAKPAGTSPAGTKSLSVYFIDVEGGQATLMVSPSGESLLVDAGWPGNNGRDADRIAGVAKRAGLSRIDYFVASHYHTDHIGGVPQLAERLPIGTFVDHGPSVEKGENPDKLFAAYAAARAKGKHLVVKPGDKVPIKGLDVRVVTAGGEAVPAKGSANPLCAAFTPKDPDPSENARSVGILVSLDRFRLLDLGDLTWNEEQELVCPSNPIGQVDVFVTTHHGSDASNAPVLVHAVRPRVAVTNNGSKKGGQAEAWKTVKSSPGLEDLWQVHYATAGGAEHNVAESFIANTDEATSFGIALAARPDGSFTVTNERTGTSKDYPARR